MFYIYYEIYDAADFLQRILFKKKAIIYLV